MLDEWLEQLSRPEFAQHVHTDHRNVAQVADAISRSAGLTITPSTDGPVRSWLPLRNDRAKHPLGLERNAACISARRVR